jgi:hypothetical protein
MQIFTLSGSFFKAAARHLDPAALESSCPLNEAPKGLSPEAAALPVFIGLGP